VKRRDEVMRRAKRRGEEVKTTENGKRLREDIKERRTPVKQRGKKPPNTLKTTPTIQKRKKENKHRNEQLVRRQHSVQRVQDLIRRNLHPQKP
jgi:hypothetical protein